jgi:outer membrane protein assembly factor BamD
MELVKDRDFVDAAILFEDIERQYPYSKWSNQAQLMTSFCYYKSQMYDESLDAIERFIALYPGSEKVSYAYYLRALNYFEQINDVERDQTMTLRSRKAFNEVINKFPNSEFVEDAKNKIDIIEDRLAAKEIEIARYYQFSHQWISAINRYNYILENHDTSVYTEESLFRLVEIYYSLGLYEEAIRYTSTLGYNFPESDWYKKSYELVKDIS